MHFDGSKCKIGLGAGIVLTSPKQDQLRYVLQIHFSASNNVAEYEAVIHGLNVAKDIGIRRILCLGDSDLVVQQSSGNWDALDANMALYRFHVQKISGFFEGCEFKHIPRAENEAADPIQTRIIQRCSTTWYLPESLKDTFNQAFTRVNIYLSPQGGNRVCFHEC